MSGAGGMDRSTQAGGGLAPGAGRIRIGLALSGGGARAAVFHLGVLGRLAEEGLLERVTFISTVSGGSLAVGLVHALSRNRWPTSVEYLGSVSDEARRRLTGVDVQREVIMQTLLRPWLLLWGRAKVVSEVIQRFWGVSGLLRDLPAEPRWIINATTYESGKNWRFSHKRMGDYILGHVAHPALPVADALAASAAVPVAIGPLRLRTSDFEWFQYKEGWRTETVPIRPRSRYVHLWDGGVYDNQGIESLYKVGRREYREGFDFLIVSDASSRFDTSKPFLLHHRAQRIGDIAREQVRGLRARGLVEHFSTVSDSGAYLQMGNPASKILRDAEMPEDEVLSIGGGCLPETEVRMAAEFGTTLRKLSEEEFDRLYRHGREVTDCTLASRCPNLFRSLSSGRERDGSRRSEE